MVAVEKAEICPQNFQSIIGEFYYSSVIGVLFMRISTPIISWYDVSKELFFFYTGSLYSF